MTEQTMDVGEIRPVATEWSPEEPRLENRVSPPVLGWEVFGTPADTPAPPVATVATVAVVSTPTLVPTAPRVVLPDVAQRVAAAAGRRPADVWVVLECLAVAIGGLSVMRALDAYGLASWMALGGALLVAARTRSQLQATSDLALAPVLRSLALVFAASSVLSVLGEASHAALVAAGWILVVAGVAVLGTLFARRSARRPVRVVVVGDRAAISRAAMRWADGSVHVIGGVLAEAEQSRLQSIVGVPTIVGLEQAADWASGRRADLVIVAPGHDLSGQQARQLAWSLERSGIRMAIADLVSDAAPHRVQARRLGMTTVVELTPTRRGAVSRVGKSLVDRTVGSLLLLAAAPFLAVTMLLIRLDSRGGALFKQVRVGRDEKPFTMYKLRTMNVDAERHLVALRDHNEGAGLLFKMQDDPRITRIGRLLRRTSMDELPQLINVVKGDMSLIGPRPALPCEVAEYDDLERRRLVVKPGMTGLWQVSGRSNLDWETSIALDLDYVDNWRLSDDLQIGLRTVQAVVGARGAY
jgi:exopolysaccharide biosynthesis polyprenyl glycosylphosphotransferase